MFMHERRCVLIEFMCVCALLFAGKATVVAIVGEQVFICMCLLMAASGPGPAHLLATPNW